MNVLIGLIIVKSPRSFQFSEGLRSERLAPDHHCGESGTSLLIDRRTVLMLELLCVCECVCWGVSSFSTCLPVY